MERIGRRTSGEFAVLTPEEIHAVMGKAESPQDAAVYAVAAFAGLRMEEIRALRWRDVDFANGPLHVRASYTHNRLRTPKSGKVRSVPLIDQAAKALDALSRRDHLTDPEDLVFISPTGGYLHDGDTRRRFHAALAAASLDHKRTGDKPMTLHDLRHTFGTLAVQVWPLSDMQAHMGHSRHDDDHDLCASRTEAQRRRGADGARFLSDCQGLRARRCTRSSASLNPACTR